MADDFYVEVDERTANMTEEDLKCRQNGGRHNFRDSIIAPSKAQRELRPRGQLMLIGLCPCGVRLEEVVQLPRFETVSRKLDYTGAPTYLIPEEHRGSGRIPVQAAKAARFAAKVRRMR